MAKNGIKKLEKNTTTGTRSGKIERRTAVIRVREKEGNERRGKKSRRRRARSSSFHHQFSQEKKI